MAKKIRLMTIFGPMPTRNIKNFTHLPTFDISLINVLALRPFHPNKLDDKDKGNNKITEFRTILQRESQNS